jgi:hypothetical protein
MQGKDQTGDEGINLVDYLKVIQKHKKLIIAIVAVAIAATIVIVVLFMHSRLQALYIHRHLPLHPSRQAALLLSLSRDRCRS